MRTLAWPSLHAACLAATVASAVLVSPGSLSVARAADRDRIDVGEEAPNFAARTLNPEQTKSKVFVLDAVVGPDAVDKKGAVLIAFLAAGCDSCLRSLPYLQALATEFKTLPVADNKDRALVVVGVVGDKDEADVKKVLDAAAAAGVTFPLLSDRFGIVSKRYALSKTNTVYVVDATQKVAKANVGFEDNQNAELLAEVRKNLSLPVSEPTPAALATFMRGAKTATPTEAEPAAKPEPEAAPVGKPEPPPAAAAADTSDEPAAPLTAPAKGKKGKKEKAPKPPKPPKAVKKAPPPAPAAKGPKKIGRKPAP